MMSLHADVRLALGDLRLDVNLDVGAGGLVVLVGPNGAGKTTLLRTLAGLQPLDDGRIELDGTVLDDTRRWVPPERRRVGLVPQDDRLLPHLTALGNVAFGLRHNGHRRADARAEAGRWLATVGLGDVAGLRPAQLSGGQAKRVALARALAVRPRLLLLDEPLAALDAGARRQVRGELKRYLDAHDCIRILVTHEPIDALALGDRIVVIEHGRIVQDVSPDELRVRPRSRYVADLVGVNLYRGRLTAEGVLTDTGAEIVAADRPMGAGDVLVVIHPRSVALHLRAPEGSPRNVWRGVVREVDDEGAVLRVRLEGGLPIVAEVTADAGRVLGLAPGLDVWAAVKATEVSVSPA